MSLTLEVLESLRYQPHSLRWQLQSV